MGLSPCSFVAVGVGLTLAKPRTDADGGEAKGAPLIAFEPEVEGGKNLAETIYNLHMLFEALNLIILGIARVLGVGKPG